jgi:peptide/nickel transport system permease protein
MHAVQLRAILFFPRRLAWLVLTFLVTTSLLFALTRGAAGDPAQTLGPGATPEQVEALRQRLGWDQPVSKQYTGYLGRILRGDFGPSLRTGRPVVEEIRERLPSTLRLLGLSIPVGIVLSLLIMAAGALVLWIRERSAAVGAPLQRLGQMGVTLGTATPVFLLGLFLVTVFTLRLRWLPALGWADVASGRSFELRHAILPALTLAVLPACLVTRSVLGDMVHLHSRSPISRGFLVPHAILVFLGKGFIQAIGMVGGVLFVETIFALPGVGRLFVQAAVMQDYALFLGLANVFLVMALLLRALADLLQGIDAFVVRKLEEVELSPPAQTAAEGPSYARWLAWAWLAACVLLVLVPFAQGMVGFLGGRDEAMATSVAERNLPPGSESADGTTHVWGTDALGRDIQSRARHAQGLGLGSSLLVVLLVLLPALLGGLLTGFLITRRAIWADLAVDVLMFPVEVLTAMPGVVLLAFILSVTGPDLQTLLIWLGLAFLLPRCVRMVQGWWVDGARYRSPWFRLAGIVLGVLILGTGLAVLTQWALGFLGLGIRPPQPDLGAMLAEGLKVVQMAPHLVSRPGGAALSAAFGWFLLADTLLSRFGVFRREAWLELNR